ncbi:MAG: branched-chain amino acid ABC transporter permease, partial [Spirochaetes bacterium]|nr:branched-chain amino acid ABC transporter permease [Spirochaetota bacterium]
MSALELLLQQLINAVSIGSLYALMAIGLAMVFGILRLINFAHGDLIMVGSYVALLLMTLGLPFFAAAAAGVAASTLAGLAMERIAYRPLRGAHEISMLLTS